MKDRDNKKKRQLIDFFNCELKQMEHLLWGLWQICTPPLCVR